MTEVEKSSSRSHFFQRRLYMSKIPSFPCGKLAVARARSRGKRWLKLRHRRFRSWPNGSENQVTPQSSAAPVRQRSKEQYTSFRALRESRRSACLALRAAVCTPGRLLGVRLSPATLGPGPRRGPRGAPSLRTPVASWPGFWWTGLRPMPGARSGSRRRRGSSPS